MVYLGGNECELIDHQLNHITRYIAMHNWCVGPADLCVDVQWVMCVRRVCVALRSRNIARTRLLHMVMNFDYKKYHRTTRVA